METVTINRMNTRMRLPAQAMPQRARIKRLLADVLDRALESAIESYGLSKHGYLCVSRANARVRLSLGQTDSALVHSIARAMADAIIRARDGETGVYYTSRVHALVDLITAAARADLRRSWAWSQLGLWSGGRPRSAAEAAERVMRALAAEPRHAVAALALAACDGAAVQALLRWAPARMWSELAVAASRAFSGAIDLSESEQLVPASREAIAISRRIFRSSNLAAAVAAARRSHLPEAAMRAIAVMVVLESEPAAIRYGGAPVRSIVDMIAIMLRAPGAEPAGSREAAQKAHAAPDERGAPDVQADAARTRVESSGRIADTHDAEEHPLIEVQDDALGEVGGEAPAEILREAVTQAGGLLYLLNLIDRIELPGAMMRDPRLAWRGLRWALNQLAIVLGGIAGDDPAALAFAGLLPDAKAPSIEGDAPDDSERSAIDEYRAAVVEHLRLALAGRLDVAAWSDEALLEFICRRRARILGDPGWIEVHYSLDDVSTEIRFAGLDFDPGWISWLGVVVRFVYA